MKRGEKELSNFTDQVFWQERFTTTTNKGEKWI